MVLNFYKKFIVELVIDLSSGIKFLQTDGKYFPALSGTNRNMLPNQTIRPG